MSVNWECGDTAAHKHAYQAMKDAGIGSDENGDWERIIPTWDIYCDLREALIWSLVGVKFPANSSWVITEDNWEAVYRRVHIYEKITGCSRRYNNGTRRGDKTRDMYFQPEEIKSMIGLRVNAGNATDAEFRKNMYDRLWDMADQMLKSYYRDLDKDDPYEWERKYGKPE